MLIETGQYIEPRALPLEEQRQILRAALQPGPEAREEAIEWLPRADIETMGFDSLRLMPQLYERLRMEGIDTPLLPRLNGLKKHAWSKNNLLLRRANDAIRALQQAGIDVMAIKGIALIVAYYRDYSLRPMYDADLLVPHQHARAACQILARHGWTNEFVNPENPHLIEQAFQYLHAAHQFDPLGRDLDLHWNLLAYRLGPGVDDDFWAGSGEAVLGGQKVRILNPADQLLHICVHGTDSPPIRWIPDALAVLRRTSDLNWDRLLAQAHKKNLTLMISRALEHVQRDFADHVPAEVLTDLHRSRVSIFERYEYWQLSGPVNPFFGWLPRTLYRFLCRSGGNPLPVRLRLFLDFLCFEWKVPRKWQLPAAFCRRATKRILGYFGRHLEA
ncbi:MAG: nucleotidyltransferase family protein [Terracidiphilus sp.]